MSKSTKSTRPASAKSKKVARKQSKSKKVEYVRPAWSARAAFAVRVKNGKLLDVFRARNPKEAGQRAQRIAKEAGKKASQIEVLRDVDIPALMVPAALVLYMRRELGYDRNAA
jgi:hypothetical protein